MGRWVHLPSEYPPLVRGPLHDLIDFRWSVVPLEVVVLVVAAAAAAA
jgi:hypothetical protein